MDEASARVWSMVYVIERKLGVVPGEANARANAALEQFRRANYRGGALPPIAPGADPQPKVNASTKAR